MPGEADARVQLALPGARLPLPCHTPACWQLPCASACPVPRAVHPAGQALVPRAMWQSCRGLAPAQDPCAAPVPPARLTASDGHGAVSPSAPTAAASTSAPGGGGPVRVAAANPGHAGTLRSCRPSAGQRWLRGSHPSASLVFSHPGGFSVLSDG